MKRPTKRTPRKKTAQATPAKPVKLDPTICLKAQVLIERIGRIQAELREAESAFRVVSSELIRAAGCVEGEVLTNVDLEKRTGVIALKSELDGA